ncbi:molybdate ABC transporter substrate-binding protein [Sphingomonas beigongshangi]|jgi:molybdate transport system substrate-binding protein|uniref:molybdate ABC transporter substrate-binding protein n=1 Tax=Sphingomonas beigongshangi TaxID=2782540 RepID=UPI001AED987E|nr:molybdate ABC transporter substrate-binding protein [Sphingomonas beigongshangi]
MMRIGIVARAIAAIAALVCARSGAAAERAGPLVLAAASLQESMTAAADAWAKRGHPRPVISFAASSALARQAEAGARADLFVSADQEWMDALEAKRLIVPASRATFLGNRLVIVAARGTTVRIPLGRAALARILAAGPLAMADTPVPAGRYGEAALRKLGVWDAVAAKVVRGDSVRAALTLVERGAAPLGIVYATDAKAAPTVRVAGVFPASSYPPITYPVARLRASTHPDAEAFRRFLVGNEARAIFHRFGFVDPR